MEVLSLCLVALATLLVTWLLKLSASFGSSSKAKKPQLLPPGPWTLPIIGSLHHFVSVLPHRRITELCRLHGPVMLLRLGEVPTVVVSSAEAAAVVMKTNDLAFANRPRSVTQDIYSCGGQGIALAPYGEQWRQMRKVCVVELLSAKQVKRLEGIRAEEDEYLGEIDKMASLMSGFSLVDLFPSSRLVRWLSNGERNMKMCCARMQGIISDIIDGRKAAQHGADSEDLLDVLLRLQAEDSLPFPLTTESIGVLIFDIFTAATETSATVLEWAMSEIFNHPKVMAKVQSEVRQVLGPGKAVIANNDLRELHYMRMVIKEVLRMHPPIPLLVPRETREDCKIMGYDIPQGTTIYVNAFAISRDPKYWDSPEEFNPERFENNNMDYYGTHFEFTPFGAGRRQCPGILFGTSTVEIGLTNLLYHFDWAHPNGAGESVDMSEKFGIATGRRRNLQLIAIPYVPSSST
ncbi:ent-isokaurene C2/C3-hydroxylase-like isoform X2 [Triticum dicoccoides]|uniref:ent-isokaurene C2/C3-hydroxylase-like isoform X2 n=1 Tax=Triticum dicoccoides TaxID=85692 RepID=UPI0018902C06|nr:ent-isokaurene C2/C3-hydroxylase-like isoform X2 [Triticum dicoccoides]